MKSIYIRNFAATASMVLLSFCILSVSFVLLGRSFLTIEKRESLSRTAEGTSRLVKARYNDFLGLADPRLRIDISTLAEVTGHTIFLSRNDGYIVSCSEFNNCEHMGAKVNSQLMEDLSGSGELDILDNLGIFSRTHYIVAREVLLEGYDEPVGYLFVSSDSPTLLAAWQTFISLFFASALLILLLALTLSYVTSKQQAKPINEMAAAARQFAHGEFSIRVHEDTDREDEIGELASAFNAMAESMEKSEELRRDFIANVSHELKTPMTTISGFADGILDGTIPSEVQGKYLRTISDETKRLSRLVRKMLELSRIQAATAQELRRNDFDIAETLKQTLLYFEGRITEKGLDVEAQLPEDSMLVLGDRDSITQVVYNLLENAIKFGEPGSVIGIALWKQNGSAYISIKNSGDTIPSDELPLIFNRFHKTDRSRSRDRDGVGLGLHIVKSILDNHKEDITASSEDGVTEFIFTLTLKPKQKTETRQKPEPKPPL